MLHIFSIALGGGMGATSRYLSVKMIERLIPISYPIGILIVNIIGSFIIGFLFVMFENLQVHKNIRAFLSIGFVGGYTSFSTYTLETITLLENNHIRMGLINILLQNGLCFMAVVLGMGIATTIRNRTVV